MTFKWRSACWLLFALPILVTSVRADNLKTYYCHEILIAARYNYDDSLDDVVSRIRRHHNGGRVLSADTVREGGRAVHRIRILNNRGRVRGLRFDGNTGRRLPRHRHYRRRRHR